ncbi:MAG: hypothetical protein KKH98_11675 [Spirochaetes bacterium]|nr:hypothetical protein [Spirochaetota bacterium]
MKLQTIQKIGGISLIAGSILFAAYSILFPLILPVSEIQQDFTMLVNDAHWTTLALIVMAGILLMIFGYMAVYSRMYAKSGIIGFLGFIFIQLAYLFQACKVTWEICLYPVIARQLTAAPLLRDGIIKHDLAVVLFRNISSISILLGIILFCLAIIRSKVFPKIAGILIFFGALAYALGPVFLIRISGIFILSTGCLILGLELIRGKKTA